MKKILNAKRIEIVADGKMLLGLSVEKAPENNQELIEFLRDLADFLAASDVEDKDALGKYSPQIV